MCKGCPVYTGYARYENSNLVSRNYSIRTYCTSSNSNLVNRTYCPRPFVVCNVNFDNILSIQLVLPAEMGGLGVSSASLLAPPAFLASALGASDFLTTIFLETFEDVSFTKALEKWFSLTNEQESPLDGTQEKWTQPLFVKTAQKLISRMNDKRSKVFNAHQSLNG